MNKILTLILLLFLLESSVAQNGDYVTFKDSNFLQALLSANLNIDLNRDSKIQFEEAKSVTKLNLANKNIFSLQGIEFFTNLKYLDCSYNFIDTIDLQKLQQLEEIVCIKSNTYELKINGLANLKSLGCSSNNLSELNLEGNNNLEVLRCYYNKLTYLKTEGLDRLVEINAHSNMLTSFEIKNMPDLKWLNCSNNQLETLIIENTPNLELFFFTQNRLKDIKLARMINLKWLHCQQNILTELDLYDLPVLETLLCDDNNLKKINISNGSAEKEISLSNNTTLELICCDEKDRTLVSNSLKSIENSKALILNNCNIRSTITYLNDLKFNAPEVPKEEALYSRTSTKYHGDITFEDVDLKKNMLISRKTYRSGEPYGKWTLIMNNKPVELDYTFNSTYIRSREERCNDSVSVEKKGITIFEDNQIHNYIAPKLKGSTSINNYLQNELIYPPDALRYGFKGTVYVQFEINAEGVVQHVKIVKGVEKHLDKEAERVIRNLPITSPAFLESKPISLCLVLPIKFANF